MIGNVRVRGRGRGAEEGWVVVSKLISYFYNHELQNLK
jgi:hypothetical protein